MATISFILHYLKWPHFNFEYHFSPYIHSNLYLDHLFLLKANIKRSVNLFWYHSKEVNEDRWPREVNKYVSNSTVDRKHGEYTLDMELVNVYLAKNKNMLHEIRHARHICFEFALKFSYPSMSFSSSHLNFTESSYAVIY